MAELIIDTADEEDFLLASGSVRLIEWQDQGGGVLRMSLHDNGSVVFGTKRLPVLDLANVRHLILQLTEFVANR